MPQITVQIDTKEKQSFKKKARSEGRSMAAQMLMLIRKYLRGTNGGQAGQD